MLERAKRIGLPLDVGDHPYTDSEIEQWTVLVEEQSENIPKVTGLVERAKAIELKLIPGEPPYTTETVERLESKVQMQETLFPKGNN